MLMKQVTFAVLLLTALVDGAFLAAGPNRCPRLRAATAGVARVAVLACGEQDPNNDENPESLEEIRPKGPMAILSGLPWWFPLAVGWLLAPQVMPEGTMDNIFAAPTARESRNMLRDERALASDRVEKELYGATSGDGL